MRKLVTVQKVENLYPIEGADFIEACQILGWVCIVKKGEVQKGDKVLYFEIDSFLPADDERFKFLGDTKTFDGKVGYRLKSKKLKGVISQGLVLPLSSFPEVTNTSVGEEVTELLKVVKYDAELVAEKKAGMIIGQAGGKFPSFIPKTDQTRIQNLPMFFKQYEHETFEETLKLDGSSLSTFKVEMVKPTFMNKVRQFFKLKPKVDVHFGVCSRNLELKRPSNDGKQSDFWDAVKKYEIEKGLPVGYAVQGELISPRIQGNHEKVNDIMFYIFDVYDINNQRYLLPQERRAFVQTYFPIALHVPVVNESVAIFEECNLEQLLSRVEGESINKGTISEGRVYKSNKYSHVHFKAISNKYLLKKHD